MTDRSSIDQSNLLEQQLHDALTPTVVDPSPGLFDRVLGSIADDRLRRRRVRRSIAAIAIVLSTLTTSIWLTTPKLNGWPVMDWWILELFTTALLVGLALWLGPFIKRFGRSYAADVFHDNPQTGKSYIVLTDIVYYLIFTAYVLFTVSFEPRDSWSSIVTPAQLGFEAARVGGILLIIGSLHGVNIVLMPVLGRLFSLNRRLPER